MRPGQVAWSGRLCWWRHFGISCRRSRAARTPRHMVRSTNWRRVMEVSGGTLLQRVTSTALLARVFAFKDAVAMAAWGLGSITVPIVIAVADIRTAILVTGLFVPSLVLLRLRALLAVDAAATV